MKKFFAIAAIALLLVSCAGKKNVKVTDPETDLAALTESVKGADDATILEKATAYIESYAKALAEKVITPEQFDAFCKGVSEKVGIAEETVKGVAETAISKVFKDFKCDGKQHECKGDHECKGEHQCAGEHAACDAAHAAECAVKDAAEAAEAAVKDAATEAANSLKK